MIEAVYLISDIQYLLIYLPVENVQYLCITISTHLSTYRKCTVLTYYNIYLSVIERFPHSNDFIDIFFFVSVICYVQGA